MYKRQVNPTVYSIEKNGMDHADCIMCVSELTRRTVINKYLSRVLMIFAMHNAVYPLSQELLDIPRPEHPKEKVVTFLGRITMQKGPEYFVAVSYTHLDVYKRQVLRFGVISPIPLFVLYL